MPMKLMKILILKINLFLTLTKVIIMLLLEPIMQSQIVIQTLLLVNIIKSCHQKFKLQEIIISILEIKIYRKIILTSYLATQIKLWETQMILWETLILLWMS